MEKIVGGKGNGHGRIITSTLFVTLDVKAIGLINWLFNAEKDVARSS